MRPLSLIGVVLMALLCAPLAFAVCTATAPNKGAGTFVSSGTTASTTFTISNSADLVVVSVWCSPSCTVNSVQDGGARAYTKSSGSPGSSLTGTGTPYVYYRLAAGTSGSTTITVTTSAAVELQIGGIDFAISGAGCVATFDRDATGTGTGAAINTPSISPAATGSVLYAFGATANSINSSDSPWTDGTSYGTTVNRDEYILSSASGATAVAFTQTSANWAAIAAAFRLAVPGATTNMPPVVY